MVTDGTARRVALCGIAAGIVIGLAACGSTVAGAGSADTRPGTAKTAITKISPTRPPAAAQHVLLCAEIPKLTRMVFTRMPLPPYRHVREILPGAVTVRNAAAVRRIATVLCGLPAVPVGVMACPNMAGGSYSLFFVAPGRAIPAVGLEYSGCRVVTGLGRPRTWATSKPLQQALSQGLGAQFRLPSPLP